MTKKTTLTRYSDSGHSWLKVKRAELERLGIEHKISSCSYQFGNNVYLEEDCDMAVYFKAALGKQLSDSLTWQEISDKFNVKTMHTNSRSKIRNYSRYSPNFRRVEWINGKKVSLYGKEYIMRLDTVYKSKALECASTGRLYRVKNTQLDDIKELKTDNEGLSNE